MCYVTTYHQNSNECGFWNACSVLKCWTFCLIFEYHIKKEKEKKRVYIYAAQRHNGKVLYQVYYIPSIISYCSTRTIHTHKRSDLLTKTIVKQRLTKWHKRDNENHVRICVWPLVVLLLWTYSPSLAEFLPSASPTFCCRFVWRWGRWGKVGGRRGGSTQNSLFSSFFVSNLFLV